MSILETPRVYFKGEITWDPIVTNNTCTFYDEADAQTVFTSANLVKGFRDQAIRAVLGGGNWNPHGTHRSVFYDTSVCGVDTGGGAATDDPFTDAAVRFTGMLVDLEPYGSVSSQLYFDGMRLGVRGGYSIIARRRSRVTARYINFGRNSANTMIAGIASVVWQTSFAKHDGGVAIEAFDSPALQQLEAALDDDEVRGLTVRFNVYRTIYFGDPTLRNGSPAVKAATGALHAKLVGGGFQPNPARSLLVGTIGLWRRGEPEHEPGDRALIAGGDSPLGSAFARLDGSALTLDLSNCVPEVTDDLTKQDLGTLAVVAVDPTSNAVTNLAQFPYSTYDRTAYEGSAGIVTATISDANAVAAAQSGLLQLRDGQGNVQLAETALRAIPETPNLYADQGESARITARVYDRGVPVAAPTDVTVYTLTSGGGKIETATTLTTDADGHLAFDAPTDANQILSYVFGADPTDTPPNGGINTQANTYAYLRVLPSDDWIGQLEPTWDNVFTYVLVNWKAMAPCMDNWLDLADPAQVKAFGHALKRHTDPANFEDFAYMPVTRDLTAGQRALLYAFLDAPPAPAVPLLAATAAVAPPQPAKDFEKLSRAMRGGAE